jgi:Tol biopolymer transport system component
VTGTLVPSPTLNTLAQEYSPRLSPDGRFLVFVSERVDGQGERDVYLYDRDTERLLPTPGLNSKTEDFDPTVIVLTGGD